jgi:hypothetical protein
MIFLVDQFRDIDTLEAALADLGRALDQRDHRFSLFVIGGSAFLLQDPTRAHATADLDVAALVQDDATLTQAAELPAELVEAADAVAVIHGLTPGWINAAAAASFDNLVPDGALDRALVRTWGGLTLHVASRGDLIRLKLQAAQRRGTRGDRYRDDLVRMRPSGEELDAARAWLVATSSTPGPTAERADAVLDAVRSRLRG